MRAYAGVAVKPEHVAPYTQAMYVSAADRRESMAHQVAVKYGSAAEHMGSWEVVVGDMGHFCTWHRLMQTTSGATRATKALTRFLVNFARIPC